jgi:hypothetical protein
LVLVQNTPAAHFPCRLVRLPLLPVVRLPLTLAVAVPVVRCPSLQALLLPMASVA